MSHPVARIVERLRHLSTTQLRIIYSTIAVLAFLWVSLIMLTHYLSISTHTDECLWKTEIRKGRYVLVVESITPGGVADRAGIRPGDIVVAINGVQVDSVQFEQFVSQRAQIALNMAPTDVPIPYVVERHGRLLEFSVLLKSTERSIPQNLLRFALPVVTFIWLLVGVMAILSQPHGNVQRRFFLAAASSVFAFMGTHFFENNALVLDIPAGIADVLDLIQLVVSGYFFSIWLSFCASFPVDRSIFSTRWRTFLLWLPFTATLATILFAMLLPDQNFNQAAPSVALQIILGLNGLLILLWISSFFTGIWLLYRGYRQLPEGANRKPMRIILAGALMSGLVPIYILLMSSIAQLLGASNNLSQWFLLPIILLPAFPLSFGYAIFKYQVMDFRRVVTTTAVYAATMTVIVAAYIGLGYAASQLFGAMSGRLGESLQIVGFIFFLLLFDPLKRQVQTAIENRFFPQHRDYSAHLVEFSEQASQMVEGEAVARLIADTLVRTLDLSNAAVVLWNQPETPSIAARISSGGDEQTIDPASLNFLYGHVQQQHGLIALDTIAAPELATLRETYTYAIGLHVRDELRGVLLFDSPQDKSTLSSRKVHFVNSLATQGSTALETVHLLEREITRHRDLEELATARRIQQNILPTTLPDFPNLSISAVSNPAQAVGGDYFNVIPLDDDHVLVIVADVSGKGLPASFYMAELHGMVCIASTTCATPSQMLATINDHLHREMPRGTFITATALLFNTRSRQLSLARAGHTPLIYRNHSEMTVFTPPGPALGFVRGGQFTSMIQEHKLSYGAGDTFVLYSDGVSEMMNTYREEFGDQRLHTLVGTLNGGNAAAIRDRIVGEVEEFRDGAEQHDDMTVVVIQVNREGT